VRIYDVSNPRAPRLVKNVQTCKGSHTHTVIPHPTDKGIVYIYVSGSQGAREEELAGCVNGTDPADEPQLALPARRDQGAAANPEQAEVVTGARIFTGLGGRGTARRPARRGGRDSAMADGTGPRNCHDVTAYPAFEPARRRLRQLRPAGGHQTRSARCGSMRSPTPTSRSGTRPCSATTASKVFFTDEWGGGTSRCVRPPR
jgi:hypothetical protein